MLCQGSIFFFFISHTQKITIHYIYNSLQVTVIVDKKRNKNKKKDKVHKNTIVYILTIKMSSNEEEVV